MLCGVAVYEQMGFCLPEDKGLLCAKWGADLDRAITWQRMQPLLLRPLGDLFWKALSACLSGRWAVTGNPTVKFGSASLYRISPYWFSLTLFLMSRTKNTWYIVVEEHCYLTCLLSFTLLKCYRPQFMHVAGKLHEFLSLASFQVKPCRKLIIKKKIVSRNVL